MKSGIYTITNIKENKIYVGHTKNLDARKSCHFTKLKKGIHKNCHLQRAYIKYGIENFEFEMLEECEEKYLIALEHYWCNILNTHDRDYGYNMRRTNPTKNCCTHSKETLLKIAEKNKGKPSGRKGKKNSLEQIRKVAEKKRKPVLQYDLEGNFIKEWSSLSDLCEKHKYSLNTISCVCLRKKNYNSAYGFLWKYKEDKHSIRFIKPFVKPVLQKSKEGIVIKKWDSIKEAASFLKLHSTTICICCKNSEKSTGGFKWDYYNENFSDYMEYVKEYEIFPELVK